MIKKGFTLAEVLIVVGIIGIIAELTIPELVNNFQKQVVVTRLEKFYTNMTQAIKLSEIDNGPAYSWDYGDGSAVGNKKFVENYIAPYYRNTGVIVAQDGSPGIQLADGTNIFFSKGSYMDVGVLFEPNKAQKDGRNKFYYDFYPGVAENTFRPYEAGRENIQGREKYSVGDWGCNSTGVWKAMCSGLIMYDGWQIKDDYPW